MKCEFSSGAILYTKVDNEFRYVLVTESNGTKGFPKGHVENGEVSTETAIREIKEETGVTAVLLDNIKRTIKYRISSNSMKQVIYYAAYFENQNLMSMDKDIIGVDMYDINTALSLLRFSELRNILIEFDYILHENNY